MAIIILSSLGEETSERIGIPPVGVVCQHPGITIPARWMVCEGQLLSTGAYPELFAKIGNIYGGDGIDSFALPNYRSSTRIIYLGNVLAQPVLQVSVPAAIHGPIPGYYKAGSVLSFFVQLLDDVAVSGGPVSLSLTIGGTSHTLAFVSGTARDWVFGDYTVQSGDNGDVTASINYNGAVLSSGGVAAVLSVGVVDSGVVVDAVAPTTPTVNALSTANTNPTITGTATVGAGEILTVTVNGVTYTHGDGDLSVAGTVWTLVIPSAHTLTTGTYSIVATVTDAVGNVSSDSTDNELVIT